MTFDEFAARLNRLDWRPLHVAVLTTTVHAAQQTAQSRAPVRATDGGALRDSLHGAVEPTGTRGTVESRVSYAAFMNDGTRAHVIRPTHTIQGGPRAGQPGYLRFIGGGGGTVVFARAVQHPGTPPRRFMEAGRDAGAAKAEADWPRLVAAWLAGQGIA